MYSIDGDKRGCQFVRNRFNNEIRQIYYLIVSLIGYILPGISYINLKSGQQYRAGFNPCQFLMFVFFWYLLLAFWLVSSFFFIIFNLLWVCRLVLYICMYVSVACGGIYFYVRLCDRYINFHRTPLLYMYCIIYLMLWTNRKCLSFRIHWGLLITTTLFSFFSLLSTIELGS